MILSTIFQKCGSVPSFAPCHGNEILLVWESKDDNVALVSIYEDFCHAYIRTSETEYYIGDVKHIDFFDKIMKFVSEI